MKYLKKNFVLLAGVVFAFGLVFFVRPAVTLAQVCNPSATTQSACTASLGNWVDNDGTLVCDCSNAAANDPRATGAKCGSTSDCGGGIQTCHNGLCIRGTYPTYQACLASNAGKFSNDVTYNSETYCEQFPQTVAAPTNTGIQGGRGCPLNQASNPCDSGLKCVPGSCVSTTQQSTTGICVVDSFTCVSSGSGGTNNCAGVTDPVRCAETSGCNWDQSSVSCLSGTPPAAGGGAGNPPVGTAPTGLGNPPVGGGTNPCGDPSLETINGICVPKGNFPVGSVAGSKTLVGLILLVLNYLLILSGLIAVVALVIGGFWYITAAGNEEQAEKGRKALLNSIIGMVIIIMAYAIVNILTRTLTTTDITKTTGN